MILDSKQVADYIEKFFQNKNPVLFAGAGVGVKAGLPSWNQFLDLLVEFIYEKDELASQLMKRYIADGHFCKAANIFKDSPEYLASEKYQYIEDIFKTTTRNQELVPLVSLPFTSIITTNYDIALHNAYAIIHDSVPRTVELTSESLKKAPFIEDFFIARIHGQYDLPHKIVFSDNDFEKLLSNQAYSDFLVNSFTKKSCLFIGFSFLDPSITNVLEIIQRRLGAMNPQVHGALLPSDSQSSPFYKELEKLNIETNFFDMANDYEALWDGIDKAQNQIKKKQSEIKTDVRFPIRIINEFISTSYARVKLSDTVSPLREIIIDGFILNFVSEGFSNIEDIIQELRSILFISDSEARVIVLRKVNDLQNRGLIENGPKQIKLTSDITNEIDDAINTLIEGIQNRLILREGIISIKGLDKLFKEIIQEVLIARGWDLGAYYAEVNKTNNLPNINFTLHNIVNKRGSHLSEELISSVITSTSDLFENPDNTESKILAQLGRIAFAIQLVLQSPCATLTLNDFIPEKIYLDSNFLMPAIVCGHPYQSLNWHALCRLRNIASSSGMELKYKVAYSFVNEIVSHRKKAIKEFNEIYFDRETLQKDIELYKPENINVFLAGFWSTSQEEPNLSFEEYLRKYAPYNNEKELSNFLVKKGIETESFIFTDAVEREQNRVVEIKMLRAYTSKPHKEKIDILIRHEAKQITQLYLDNKNGIRSLLVSSDSKLKNIVKEINIDGVENSIINHIGFIQLIDLTVGLDSDHQTMSRLYWSNVAFTDENQLIINYFTNLGLKHRDEAMALSLDDTLKLINDDIQKGISKYHINLNSSDENEHEKTIRFFEFMEDRFYQNMSSVIKKKFPDVFNLAESEREKNLEDKINKYQQRLVILRKKIEEIDNDEEKRKLLLRQSMLTEYLHIYHEELEKIRS